MELFISGFLLSLSLCVDIGIVNVAIIKTGIEKGFAPSFNIGLGSSFGDITYASLSLLGVSAIVQFLFVRWFLWIAGTIVLLYLSFKMLVELFKPFAVSENQGKVFKPDTSLMKYFVNGYILALSSPTAILWFITVGGSIIATHILNSKFELFYFFGGFFASSVTWSIMLAFISYKGGQLMGNKVKRIFSILSILIFLLMAVYIFLDGYKNLIR
jgi:L-lysine exporter family protein LysE/ArgO